MSPSSSFSRRMIPHLDLLGNDTYGYRPRLRAAYAVIVVSTGLIIVSTGGAATITCAYSLRN